jgi:tetratricopeptide (TPR) repeat protein
MSDSSDTSKPAPEQALQPGAPYKKGDFIGQKYEVYGILGKGGFGVVYLAYSHELGEVYALKTFLDEFLADQEVRKRFQKEASVWVELGRHPYLVRASYVDEVSSRLYIAMEYIAPNEEGLNSLEGYLQQQPPDLAQSLRWAVQICHGMEYAYSKGLRAHRDLKPANIMITQDGTAKITDFGLAGVISESTSMGAAGLIAQPGRPGLSGQTMLGAGFGTPAYMPPEQFDNAAGCDERSDIYSFGIVLYQMAASGWLPFPVPMGADWQAMRRLHRESPVPRLESPLFPIIQRCLEKSPEKRYQTFKEVRRNLEPLLQHQTGEVIIPPQSKELEAWEWSNKGASLNNLGRPEEAIHCYDTALELDPRNAHTWSNKGTSLDSLGRHEEAVRCFDKALELDPRNAHTWSNKGSSLGSLGRYEEEIRCYDKALELDPRLAKAWNNEGNSLTSLGRNEEAIRCLDKALELDPRDAAAWNNKGNSLNSLERCEEAIRCFDTALGLDPRNAAAWSNKGGSLSRLGRHEEAIRCFDKALEFDQHIATVWTNKGGSLHSLGRDEEAIRCCDQALELDPRDAAAWNNKGISLDSLERHEEAIRCLDQALELDPRNAHTWSNKATGLGNLNRYEEAIGCYDKALELDPRFAGAWAMKGGSLDSLGRYEEAIICYDKALELDPRNAAAWINKALAEDILSQWREAAHSYQQFLTLAPAQQYSEQIEHVRQRLRELGGK